MATKVQEIEQEVRAFLAENFILDDGGAGIDREASLTGTGVLDSMGVLEVIMFIEERYGISVAEEDTVPENLDSIVNIGGYVERRLAEAEAA